MRRLIATALLVIAAAVGAAAIVGGPAQDTRYRVDAVFDDVSFLSEGQDVKIAGAKAGTVTGITLTEERKARVEMEIDPRFGPFRGDADCTIQPQSLIGEKFIQCTPGTLRAPALRARPGEAPTVPVANTHSPVDLDVILTTFRAPERERLALIVASLGAGLSGRPGDLNLAIRRAAPALQETERVLDVLERDRRRLSALVGEAERVVGALARRRQAVGRFVDEAATVAQTAGGRDDELALAVRRLPGLLAEAQPAFVQLDRLATTAAPVLREAHAAAPGLDRLIAELTGFARAGRPALRRISAAAGEGVTSMEDAAPAIARLRGFSRAAEPASASVGDLFGSMRERGAVEGLQSFVYYAGAAMARFDRTSHILPAYLVPTVCEAYQTETAIPECDAHFAATREGGGRSGSPRSGRRDARRRPPARPAPGSAGAIDRLLDYLLG